MGASKDELRTRFEEHSDDELRAIVGSDDYSETAWQAAAELLTERGHPTKVPEPEPSTQEPTPERPRSYKAVLVSIVAMALLVGGFALLTRARSARVAETRAARSARFNTLAELGERVAAGTTRTEARLSEACAGKTLPDVPGQVGLYVARFHPDVKDDLALLVTKSERETEKMPGDAWSKIELWYPQARLLLADGTPHGAKIVTADTIQSHSEDRPDLSLITHLVTARAAARDDALVMQASVVDMNGTVLCAGIAPVVSPTAYVTFGFGSTQEEQERDSKRSRIHGLMSAVNASFLDAVLSEFCAIGSKTLCSAKSPEWDKGAAAADDAGELTGADP